MRRGVPVSVHVASRGCPICCRRDNAQLGPMYAQLLRPTKKECVSDAIPPEDYTRVIRISHDSERKKLACFSDSVNHPQQRFWTLAGHHIVLCFHTEPCRVHTEGSRLYEVTTGLTPLACRFVATECCGDLIPQPRYSETMLATSTFTTHILLSILSFEFSP